ncbi:DUF3073 domain-containing protein [Actinotalea sp. M2MS4P-6]|uniref:DUF3073 domain-containing protein n=1 Tax=Actinotalea sp. M2MS4P-6 TaxID=2983762 RepID=UPI0021E47F1B|nr:DUF3073 domain-containing protein [Actinotalea sp. M2MS4P-6]MCV2395273.1 DUF3073 domain-containing protein [Actinotalea sp. M2MS4P-6]
MGRGRQKAKQTKVARELKYSIYEPNYKALEQELTSAQRHEHADEDQYASWADDEDDESEDDD